MPLTSKEIPSTMIKAWMAKNHPGDDASAWIAKYDINGDGSI